MKRLSQAIGLLLAFSLCLVVRAADAPAKQDLKKHEDFARRIQKLVRDNKVADVAGCFDNDALFARALRDLSLPAGVRKSVDKALKEKDFAGQLSARICNVVQQDGSYTLLRVRVVDGQPRALFRLLAGNGLNYHDLLLGANAAGELRVIDLYIAISGELSSDTMRRMACLMVSGDPKQAERLNPGNDFIKNAARIERFLLDAKTGRYREGLKEWAELPATVHKEKLIALMRVVCAQGLLDEDEKGYEKAMDDFRKAFPNDPSLDLVSLDNLFIKKKFRTFHRNLDRIERFFGRDPYLDVLRAGGFMEDDKLDEAKKVALRAVKDEPDLIAAYWTLLTVSLRSRDHKEALRLLFDIEKRFKVEFDDLTAHEEYKGFVKSPEYKKWMEGRKKF